MNFNNPLVSVAIITYNQKEYLKECIESVLAQTYTNIEIVVGDDGSTDGTHEMLSEYEKRFPGKFVLRLSNENFGITVNSNNVHFACRGKYVAWIGGDDLMLAEKIEKQVRYLEKNPDCNIVYHHVEVFNSDTGKTTHLYNTRKDCYEGDVRTVIRHGTFNCACATMVRFAASPEYGYDLRLKVASDWWYWVEHLSGGGKIGFIDEILGRYRRHSKNVSGEISPLAKQGMKDTFFTCELILDKFPQYRKLVIKRKADIYRWFRNQDFRGSMIKSLLVNPIDVKTLTILFVYYISFKKIKL